MEIKIHTIRTDYKFIRGDERVIVTKKFDGTIETLNIRVLANSNFTEMAKTIVENKNHQRAIQSLQVDLDTINDKMVEIKDENSTEFIRCQALKNEYSSAIKILKTFDEMKI